MTEHQAAQMEVGHNIPLITKELFVKLRQAHDLPDSFLGAIGVLNLKEYEVILNSPTIWRTVLWTLYIASALSFAILFPKAVGAAQKIKPMPAVFIGLASFFVYQIIFLVFNR